MTASDVVPVRSDRCGLDEMFLAYQPGQAERGRLGLGPEWPRQWTATWRTSGGDVVSPVRDLESVPVGGCEPVRRFSWRRRQRHRPGLQFTVSTGRLHGFESLEERVLLLALDFTGAVEEIVPQPFLLRFGTAGSGFREHVPDFLAMLWALTLDARGGLWAGRRMGSPAVSRHALKDVGRMREDLHKTAACQAILLARAEMS